MKIHLLLVAAILAACGSDRVAGTGSQTGNSVVAGLILSPDSSAAMGVAVTLVPASWTADSSHDQLRSVVTDSMGGYRFDDVGAGVWRLESHGSDAALVRTLRVASGRDSTLPPLVGMPAGNLVVEVHLNDTLRAGTLEVLGTALSRSLKSTAPEIYLKLPGLAPGAHWLVLCRADGTPIRQAVAEVRSGKTDTLGNPRWLGQITGPQPDGDDDEDDVED